METFLHAVASVTIILLLTATGYFCAVKGWMTVQVKTFISRYLMTVGIPRHADLRDAEQSHARGRARRAASAAHPAARHSMLRCAEPADGPPDEGCRTASSAFL